MEENTLKPINSFVAMFDFLAFKALRKELGTEGIHQLYIHSILQLIQHAIALKGKKIQRNEQNVSIPDFGYQSLNYRIVSDSIILFADGSSFDHFLKIIAASHKLLCSGFVGHKATLRGAIGYGDLIYDANSIWVGSAIEDAYVGESSQVWSGCSLTSACEKFVLENEYISKYKNWCDVALVQESDSRKGENIKKAKKRIVEYNIPEQSNPKTGVKYSERMGYVLDWTLNVYEGAGVKAFSETTSNHAKKIIENTRLFEVWARKNNR